MGQRMMNGISYYAVRILWTGTGATTTVLAAVADVDPWLKVFVGLCGVITLLLSILLGGFVKHLASHDQHSRALDDRLKHIPDKEQCRTFRTSIQEVWTAKLDAIHTQVETLATELRRRNGSD